MYQGLMEKPFHKAECRCEECCQWMVNQIEKLNATRKVIGMAKLDQEMCDMLYIRCIGKDGSVFNVYCDVIGAHCADLPHGTSIELVAVLEN